MDEVFSLNDQDTSDQSEFGIADDKHSMVTDYENNVQIGDKLRAVEEENERLRSNMKKLKKRMIQTSQMVQLYTNAQEHLQQSVQREFEAQKQIEALRHQIEELIGLAQPQVDRLSVLEGEIERLNTVVQEKDIQIKSKESLINQLKAEAQKAEELAQMEKHLENTTKETEVLKKEIKLKTIQYRKWSAKTEALDTKIKDEQEKIAELERILANRKEPNAIEMELLRMRYLLEERDCVISDKEKEIQQKIEKEEEMRYELEETKILLAHAQEEAKQNRENYEMKIIRLEQKLKVKRNESTATLYVNNNSNNNSNVNIMDDDVLQMHHKPTVDIPTDLVNNSMDMSDNNNTIMEIFGMDLIMDEDSNNTFDRQIAISTEFEELSPDNNPNSMHDVTETVEAEGSVPLKKQTSTLAKRTDESDTDHMQRVVSTFLGFTPLNHTYLQASRHLKNYSSEDIAKTILQTIEQTIQTSASDSINYKRTLFFASHLSKAKVGFLDVLVDLLHREVLVNFNPQLCELLFNIATVTHHSHIIYEIVYNWLAQQTNMENIVILRLAIKYLPPPSHNEAATESLFWTLCIIVYRNEFADLKEVMEKKVTSFNVDKQEDDIIMEILHHMVEPSSTQFYFLVVDSIIKFGNGQQTLSKILTNMCKLESPNIDAGVQKTFHVVLKTILTKNAFLFSFHRKLPFWLQLVVAQVLVEKIIEADNNYEIFVDRLSLWLEYLDKTQKDNIPEDLANYLLVVENFVRKKC